MIAPSRDGRSWGIDATALALMAALTAACYLGGVRPVLRAAEAARADAAALEEARAAMESATARSMSAAARLEQLQRAREGAVLELSPGSEINERIRRITELADAAGLKITEIKSDGQHREGAGFTMIPIRLAASGTFPDFAGFLSRLHTQYRDVQVVSFRVAGQAMEPAPTTVFDAELIWYAGAESDDEAAGDGSAGAAGAPSR